MFSFYFVHYLGWNGVMAASVCIFSNKKIKLHQSFDLAKTLSPLNIPPGTARGPGSSPGTSSSPSTATRSWTSWWRKWPYLGAASSPTSTPCSCRPRLTNIWARTSEKKSCQKLLLGNTRSQSIVSWIPFFCVNCQIPVSDTGKFLFSRLNDRDLLQCTVRN